MTDESGPIDLQAGHPGFTAASQEIEAMGYLLLHADTGW
jgi:hypothetical protein